MRVKNQLKQPNGPFMAIIPFLLAAIWTAGALSEQIPMGIDEYKEELAKAWREAVDSIDRARLGGLSVDFPESLPGAEFPIEIRHLARTDPGSGGSDPVELLRNYIKSIDEAIEIKGRIIMDLGHNSSERGWALSFLGEEAPHQGFVPFLKLVSSSSQEPFYVRYTALTALAQTPHDTIVEDILSYLEDRELSSRAWELLGKLTESEVKYRDDDKAGMAEEYHRWWSMNKDQFIYDRHRLLQEW